MDTLRILLVEDDPDIRDITLMILELAKDLEIDAFDTGAAALDFITSTQKRFDVALLDYHLPDVTALELERQLHHLPGTADTHMILFTASLLELRDSLPPDSDWIGIIAKPFNPTTLADRIRCLHEQNMRVDGCRLKHLLKTCYAAAV